MTSESLIAREWDDPPGSAAYSWEDLEPDLIVCVRSPGIGTRLDQLGTGFGAWREEHHKWYAKGVEELRRLYAEQPSFTATVGSKRVFSASARARSTQVRNADSVRSGSRAAWGMVFPHRARA